LQFLTDEHAKELLAQSHSVLDAAYDSGLSSPGRLHDLFVNLEAMTPGEFKSKGAGLKISYGFHPTPFGPCLLAITDRGICGISFVSSDDRRRALEVLKSKWPGATFSEDPERTAPLIDKIFPLTKRKGRRALNLFLRGTNFQIKVWEGLLRIPAGSVVCYEDIARHLGEPQATRAVGSAVGQNPVAFVIPCHRVIRKTGVIGGYHWGAARKKAMLAWEAGRTEEFSGGRAVDSDHKHSAESISRSESGR
jgi:AraC family transcriptional regulator of adaptative response/methylated-DNA-[protein]-cysteine methyltransferase